MVRNGHEKIIVQRKKVQKINFFGYKFIIIFFSYEIILFVKIDTKNREKEYEIYIKKNIKNDVKMCVCVT